MFKVCAPFQFQVSGKAPKLRLASRPRRCREPVVAAGSLSFASGAGDEEGVMSFRSSAN